MRMTSTETTSDPLPGLREHVAEDPNQFVELRLPRDQRRDLDDGIAAVVRAADQPGVEHARREEASEQRFALLLRKRLVRHPVLDELERVEEARPAEVADDRQL